MDEIKLKCDIHVSVVLLCMVILKSVKIIMGELIKKHCNYKILYICNCILL